VLARGRWTPRIETAAGPAGKNLGRGGQEEKGSRDVPLARGGCSSRATSAVPPTAASTSAPRLRPVEANPLAHVKLFGRRGLRRVGRGASSLGSGRRARSGLQGSRPRSRRRRPPSIHSASCLSNPGATSSSAERTSRHSRMKTPAKPQYALAGSIDSISLLRRDLPSLPRCANLKRSVDGPSAAPRTRRPRRPAESLRSSTAAGVVGLWEFDQVAQKIAWWAFGANRRTRRLSRPSNARKPSSPAILATPGPSASTAQRAARPASQRSARRACEHPGPLRPSRSRRPAKRIAGVRSAEGWGPTSSPQPDFGPPTRFAD